MIEAVVVVGESKRALFDEAFVICWRAVKASTD
jgi:hypothetical protein